MSFYHCVRFPLNHPKQRDLEVNQVYRRQHGEGAIHDSWTKLAIQQDDGTGETKIVESRCEWVGTSTQRSRTFYITALHFEPSSRSDELSVSSLELHESDRDGPSYPLLNDRPKSSFHSKITPERNMARTFLRARTKLDAYSLSSHTFIDLVEDEECCRGTDPCLRIRVESRRAAPLD